MFWPRNAIRVRRGSCDTSSCVTRRCLQPGRKRGVPRSVQPGRSRRASRGTQAGHPPLVVLRALACVSTCSHRPSRCPKAARRAMSVCRLWSGCPDHRRIGTVHADPVARVDVASPDRNHSVDGQLGWPPIARPHATAPYPASANQDGPGGCTDDPGVPVPSAGPRRLGLPLAPVGPDVSRSCPRSSSPRSTPRFPEPPAEMAGVCPCPDPAGLRLGRCLRCSERSSVKSL